MKLRDMVNAYIDCQRSRGLSFCSDVKVLRFYCRTMGDVTVEEVRPESVLAFIAGCGPVTARWVQNYRILGRLYRYAIGRGLASVSPLPAQIPRLPPPLTPYIYSVAELERLLTATAVLPKQALTMRTLLLLLYGTGMRIGEALSLTIQDVDLLTRVIIIRDTKFYKTRMVPIGPRLTMVLADYLGHRSQLPLPAGDSSVFLSTRTGHRLTYAWINGQFRRVRQAADIRREDGARYQPRIHDIRHTAAVHRIIAWYRAGDDVQRLLPQLATYFGHVGVASTQQYISITTELMHEASLRFERYAQLEIRHA
ncbi:tyrosine-type recombinase/integrase [Paraburkholderia caribensis]|uniref:Integrase family protein n=2 Tax=Paraburkholderia TaxID=1822464 RepID=B2JY17_PARP8|nr:MULTISPECIES: tyrosine-type recombinase/integrase [Paraburkholderia]ACC76525.1 integrase family protein [Paraburkholderia phymatum STM815]MCO4880986.1 tyrosine-type recombinase/integrase [Paraburkholderia caribensis]PTB25781.1 integrase [Paraburkholderia caribensis]